MPTDRPVAYVAASLEDYLKDRLDEALDVRFLPPTMDQDDVIPHIADADGLLASNQLYANARLFDAAPRLRVHSGIGVGYDRADVPEATRRGIAVCNTPGVLTGAVADLTIASIIMLMKRLDEHLAYVRDGRWSRREPQPPLGHDINGKLLGIVGYGRIGREVARRAQALGMRTVFHDLFDEAPDDAPICAFAPLDELLRESDVVTMHVDLNDTSRHMMSTEQFALMKPTAYFINTSRGPVVDQPAITEALRSGQIAAAALDVFEREPVNEEDDLIRLPNVLPFAHMATATVETREAMRGLAVDNLIAVLTGNDPPECVNREVLGG